MRSSLETRFPLVPFETPTFYLVNWLRDLEGTTIDPLNIASSSFGSVQVTRWDPMRFIQKKS
uniref:Uncharacterized protein n=1 Tax=viral metagenome TaxID=1070528 RepID=A0A6C0IWK0_9ZZZZ